MKLSDIVTSAKYSELNTLAIKDNVEAIVSFVNLGLVELYKEFILSTEEYIIELEDAVTIYDLPSNFMYMTGAFEAPPEGSCENSRPLPINEEGNPFSVNTINYKQVQVPLSVTGAYVSILYVPKPIVLTPTSLDAEIPLPNQLIQPLLNYIAFKGHGAVRTETQGTSDIYYTRFRRSCDDVKRMGVAIAGDDLSMDTRVYTRGFP